VLTLVFESELAVESSAFPRFQPIAISSVISKAVSVSAADTSLPAIGTSLSAENIHTAAIETLTTLLKLLFLKNILTSHKVKNPSTLSHDNNIYSLLELVFIVF
jgi:hypothetical protein